MPLRRHHDYDERWQIATALLDKPRSLDELVEYFRTMGRRFGLFADISRAGRRHGAKEKITDFLVRSLERMQDDRWVAKTENLFDLTECGRIEAEKFLKDMRRAGATIGKLSRPETVSAVTMGAHFVLALVKLPAAVVSHSVGLLNDAMDTLVDGISSLLVFFGVRRGRERLVTMILVGLMALTGAITAVQAAHRLISGAIPTPDFLVFAAVVVSALLCGGLYFYQRYVGLARKCVPLIAQSVDSKNHVLVAGGVIIDLVAALARIPYVDGIVGLIISGLIMKGATELLVELIRSRDGAEPDLSAYGFSRMQRYRSHSLSRWLLLQVADGKILALEDLELEASKSLDFTHIATFEALGIAESDQRNSTVDEAIRLIRDGQLVDGNPLRLTDKGRSELDAALTRRLAAHPGGPIRNAINFTTRVVGLAFSLGMTGFFALGLRWLGRYLPDVAVLRPGAPVLTILGLHLASVDLWLVGAGALVYLAGQAWFLLRRQPSTGGRPRRPLLTHLAWAASLILLSNSWWSAIFVGVECVGAVVLRSFRSRRRITQPDDT